MGRIGHVHMVPLKCQWMSMSLSHNTEYCMKGEALCKELIEIHKRYSTEPCIISNIIESYHSHSVQEQAAMSIFLDIANQIFTIVDCMPTLSFSSKKEWFIDSLEIFKEGHIWLSSLLSKESLKWVIKTEVDVMIHNGFAIYEELLLVYIKILELSIKMKSLGILFTWHDDQ